MHSLLDDAFALVSPTSQASNAGITLPGLGVRSEHTALSSPPSRGPRPCGPTYPVLSPFSGVRYNFCCEKRNEQQKDILFFFLLPRLKQRSVLSSVTLVM